MAEQAVNGADQAQAQFNIQRIYTKDISFETPNSPTIFAKEWKPEVKLDLDTKTAKLEENVFEVTLSVTVTASVEDQVAFLCEVQQAGIFIIGADIPEPNRAQLLGAFCPNTLFPYAREAISNLVNRGTFPPLNLAPVNFDAVFQAYLQNRAKEEAQASQADA